MQVSVFNGYAVFGLQDEKKKQPSNQDISANESEDTQNEQSYEQLSIDTSSTTATTEPIANSSY